MESRKLVLMNLRNRDTDIENGFVDKVGEKLYMTYNGTVMITP